MSQKSKHDLSIYSVIYILLSYGSQLNAPAPYTFPAILEVTSNKKSNGINSRNLESQLRSNDHNPCII